MPTYSVFYQVLTRLDAEAFARLLSGWLQQRAGELPAALDGKMIRECIGIPTLAQHEDGAPQAVALFDQKEGIARCELRRGAARIGSLPALDGKLVTADALHGQKATARAIVEKDGDYLLQIKGNQPGLLAQAQALDALRAPPFFSEHNLGHGRLETRALRAFAIEPAAAFPFARTLIVVRSSRTEKRSGKSSDESRC